MKIIYCDNHILIVSKPAGMSTQPNDKADPNLLDAAKAWVKREFSKPGKVFLEPIHRLDKPVSGLVLFARTSKALSRLQEMMRGRLIEKTYFAWIEGELPDKQGTLEHYLVHDSFRARIVSSSHPEAKWACLHYVQVKQYNRQSLVEIQLVTGRYHQIRAQLAAIGCPIIGDAKYGSRQVLNDQQIALHSGRLTFSHPVTKAPLSFEEIPEFIMSKNYG
jgi:23S rRNA pseudouridine1911/1915/1917 synthase